MALVLTLVFATLQTGVLLDQDHLGLLLTARVPSEYFTFRQGVATGDSVTVARAWSDRKMTDSP
jgi:hypothetical protein